MKLEWKQILIAFILGVLLAGGLGALALKYNAHRRWGGEPGYARMVERFNKKLDLTAEQSAKVAAILEEKRKKIKALRGEFGPRFEEIRNSARAEIRGVLDDRQREKFDKLQAKDSRWKKRRPDGE
ncbi:MAG: hypothetical protein A3G41_04020 [Elusimicrobia bacterium RIFCSPLOWO2_12_FULL_59_9]|nr:MAG: hypothetical protein A3G41_04020 [Elusimicrobia bacterium RIFCSPLOWO2_12_FULL_59_9]